MKILDDFKSSDAIEDDQSWTDKGGGEIQHNTIYNLGTYREEDYESLEKMAEQIQEDAITKLKEGK